MRILWLQVVATILGGFLASSVSSAPIKAHNERYYQEKWCSEHGGEIEVILPDKTRADCITADNVIEFDFGEKWAESIGQALYYSIQTGQRAGIVLILETPKDRKYFIRLNSVIQQFNLPVDTWELIEKK